MVTPAKAANCFQRAFRVFQTLDCMNLSPGGEIEPKKNKPHACHLPGVNI
jgi:hypothetical protein